MTSRRAAGRLMPSRLREIEYPQAALLAVLLGGIAAYGWTAEPVWAAAVIGVELVLAGFGTVLLLGPVRAQFGFARYATPGTAAACLTLFGRLLTGWAQLAAIPFVILALWAVLILEIQLPNDRAPRVAVDLALVGIVFAAAAGVTMLLPADSWPPPLVLLMLATAVPALRSAELRGRFGSEAIGQTLLHLLAIVQVAAAISLLELPGVVGSAILALTFHAWAGAAEALDNGASARSVIVEYGSLALLGLAVAILVRG